MNFAWYLEVSAISIALMILIIYRPFSNYKDYKDKLYIYICILTLIMAFGDIYWIAVDTGMFESHLIGHQYAANIVWNAGMYLSAFFWFLFCETLYGRKWTKNRKFIILSAIPSIISIIAVVISTRIGLMFEISEQGEYTRGIFMYIGVLICFSYLIAATVDGIVVRVHTTSFRKRRDIYAVLGFPVPPIVAGVIQLYFPGIPLVTIACAYSLLICYSLLKSSDIETDILTGLANKNGMLYKIEEDIYDLKHNSDVFGTKQVALVVVDINKLSRINTEFGRKEGDLAILRVTAILKEACEGYKCKIARFNGDKFGIVTSVIYNGQCEEIENNIEKKIKENNNQPNLRYFLNISMGHAVYLPEMKGNPMLLLDAAIDDMAENIANSRQHIQRGGIE